MTLESLFGFRIEPLFCCSNEILLTGIEFPDLNKQVDVFI